MLKSVLLYLESAEQAAPVIEFGVSLARQTEARVRGLTLVDTRRFEESQDCESAAFVSLAHTRHAYTECVHEGARAELSRACLAARLNFDVRRLAGNPLDVLPAESRFHDLVIASPEYIDRRLPPAAAPTSLSLADTLQLLGRGVEPLLILPRAGRPIERVLLVYDGSEAAGRAIRSYFTLGVLRSATHRLLAIGATELEARSSLAEMADYSASHCPALETGAATGKLRRVVTPYAKKWEADLLVVGLNRETGWLQRMLGRSSLELAEQLNCALFART
jgi:nucleotide-binding universal stress UspA family protein